MNLKCVILCLFLIHRAGRPEKAPSVKINDSDRHHQVEGDPVGEVSKLHLSMTVIDSRITWFTTGAAILLFAGAITQSVRRVRRSRNEE